jgi:D-alanyl-D-alanine dipeptidase
MNNLLPKVKIIESGEKLEVVDSNEFVVEPMYFKWKHTNDNQIKLRSGVIERLRKVKSLLQENHENWNIKIWDGYRPLKLQKILYDEYFHELKDKHPDWGEEKIHENVIIFICPPSHDPLVPSPHNTGGAVDLTLVDAAGEEIDMGTKFDEFNEKAFTDHFKDSEDEKELMFHKNRMLMKELLEKVGFKNYEEEWWHFNYGNPQWANDTRADHAIYGSCELK